MRGHIELDISDVMKAIEEFVAKRAPGLELTGVTVMSWRQVVFVVDHGKLGDPFHHWVREGHRKVADQPADGGEPTC